MNIIAYKKDLNNYSKYIDIINKYKNDTHSKKEDAIWKWSAILEAIEKLGIKPKNVLDIGSGEAHLAYIIQQLYDCNVVSIDISILYKKLNNDKCKFVKDDFFKYNFGEKFDLIIDSCAIIHFNYKSEICKNDGCYLAGKKIKELLMDGGYFIISSDILDDDDMKMQGEFISYENLISSFELGGLKLVGEKPIRDSEMKK